MNQVRNSLDVIIPVYNASTYLCKCIDSLLPQSKYINKVICYDDGSTDNSLDILKEYKASYPNFISIIGSKRVGLVKALNLMIKASDAEYLMRMDADDISIQDRAKIVMSYIEKYAADVFYSNYLLINNVGKLTFPYIKIAPKESNLLNILNFHNPICHPTVIFRRKLICNYLYNEKYETCEDYKLWFELLKSNCNFKKITKFTILYRIHDNQVTKQGENIDFLLYEINQYNKIKINRFKSFIYLFSSVSSGSRIFIIKKIIKNVFFRK